MTVNLSGGLDRLWALIEERSRPNADTAVIDRRIWTLFGERWAVLFTDLAGFSRSVEAFGILHFLQTIYEHRKLVAPLIADHDGVLVKEEGDSLLVLFRDPSRALDCAMAMQRACARVNERRKPEEMILLCAGIGYGDVLRIGDVEVWGRELNGAAKLGEDTAKAGEILVTSAVKDALAERSDVKFAKLDVDVAATDGSYRVEFETA